jgi:long-chain fatty acid transport protein
VMIGTEYRWMTLDFLPYWEVAVRGGYQNQQTQVPDRTFNPGVPSANTHIPSIGIGLLCRERGSMLGLARCGDAGVGRMKPRALGLDFSYQIALYEDRTITGNQNPTVNGTYKTVIHAGGITLHFMY